MRDDLNASAERRIAVLDPVRLVIDNYPEGRSENAPRAQPSAAARARPSRAPVLARALDRARRLRRGTAEGLLPTRAGRRSAAALRLHREVHRRREGREGNVDASSTAPTIRRRRAGRRAPKRARSRATSTGSPSTEAVPAQVRLYDRLFARAVPRRAQPPRRARWWRGAAPSLCAHAVVVAGDDDEDAEAAERSFLDDLNPASKRVITAYVEPRAGRRRRARRASSSSAPATSWPIATSTQPGGPCSTAR